jgi:copper chaperone CopZ
MSTISYPVTGLTCDHCVGAVTEEVSALEGVSAVQVDLVAGGTSTLTITAAGDVPTGQISAALDEAGDYRLADSAN